MNYLQRFLKSPRNCRKYVFTATLIAAALPFSITGGSTLASDPFGIYITKFCSDTGNNQLFEFVQVTNLGSSSVNMSGWSEDDSSAVPNQTGHSLLGLGTLAPGQSGVITQATASDFETYWWGSPANAPVNFKVVGGYSIDNLSTSSDSVTLFNGTTLEDRIDYSTTTGGSGDLTVRNAPFSAVGLNNNHLWVNSGLGDQFGSFRASGISPFVGIIGNPAYYAVPEPGTLSILALSALGLLARRRRAGGH